MNVFLSMAVLFSFISFYRNHFDGGGGGGDGVVIFVVIFFFTRRNRNESVFHKIAHMMQNKEIKCESAACTHCTYYYARNGGGGRGRERYDAKAR